MEPMDLDRSSAPTRKVRFAPKGPPRRKKAVAPKTEENPDEADDKAAQDLLRRVKDHLGRGQGPKVEKKSSVHVAFGHGTESSTSIKTYGKPRERNGGKSDGPALKDSVQANELITIWSPPTTSADGTRGSSAVGVDTSSQKIKKDYKELWDYNHSYYPITLPLRRPYSGDPEQLDEAEFGKGAADLEYDEDVTNSAAELGLLDENENAQMLFLQFPPILPLVKRGASADGQVTVDNSELSSMERASHIARGEDVAGSSIPLQGTVSSAAAKGKEKVGRGGLGVSPSAMGNEIVGSSAVSRKRSPPMKGYSLEELPAGYMGKMLVYKSGAIKLKLGDTLYDVSPGSGCLFAQDIVAINTVDKDCYMIGEIGKRAVVTPDIDSLLANDIDLS